MTSLAVIVLAAGMGTRMKSGLPKVMHKAAGRSLLGHVLAAAKPLSPARVAVVSGSGIAAVEAETRAHFADADIAIQPERRGTGHAVSMAAPALGRFPGTVLVLYGDVPLIEAATLERLATAVTAATPVAVLGFRAANPSGYGRLIETAPGRLASIVEHVDATPEQRAVNFCNSGIIAVQAPFLWDLLPRIGAGNRQGEIYFTDLVELAVREGHACAAIECPEGEVIGVNSRAQLAKVEAALQERYRTAAMEGGATLVAPETVYFSHDTVIGRDVLIEPHVIFGPGVEIGDGVEILGFSHIEGARIGAGTRVGPFARLRPGADLAENVHIGNYVEVKKATVGKGAKINHLSYVGDAQVGAGTNVGAGTITCNYDGFDKHLTVIGADVFVGSNTALVAPVKVGDGANIAAGSVITREVPAGALAMTRAALELREGWAVKYRRIKASQKTRRAKS